jgi:hypothetical protein
MLNMHAKHLQPASDTGKRQTFAHTLMHTISMLTTPTMQLPTMSFTRMAMPQRVVLAQNYTICVFLHNTTESGTNG